ncbi:hypothetical protein JIQ42_00950 [Leishmania sp. Namibia]|uniref:hypothetical protein n=1 Tax=Leishmania sp. Namibia TaxID=2802991 RepID=UPI001B5E53BB|nr:hypothetical protein JIQ42_00950 [Leishmania sp. Namibia]
MLLKEDSIAQQFSVIFRVAQLLQQATLSTVISKPTYGIGAVREVGGATVATLPDLKADSSESGTVAAQAQSASRVHSTCRARVHAADGAVLRKPLQLPLVNTDESVTTLRQIGWALDEAARQLQVSVDAQLVDFYEHLKAKGDALLPAGTKVKERVAPTRDSPQDNFFSPVVSRPTSRQVAQPPLVAISQSRRFNAEKGDAACTGSAGPRPTFLVGADGTEEASPRKDAAEGASALVTTTSAVAAVHTEEQFVPSNGISGFCSLDGQQLQRRAHLGVSSSSGLLNAPMARRLEEERAAASELQSFFYILLETALRLSGASAAAVYMDDAPPLAAGGTEGPLCRPTSTSAAASGTVGSGRAQFLHCIAHLHGHFPSDISYAVSSVLTTVVNTGVAVNVHYSDSSLLHFTSGSSGAAAPASGRAATSTAGGGHSGGAAARRRGRSGDSDCAGRSLLDMYNGVIVPIKGIGCLVLANKAKAVASDVRAPRFSIFDEHVAWSVALLTEAVLHRYERQLLLRVPWSPSCVSALRPYVQEDGPQKRRANLLPGRSGASAMRERRGPQIRTISKNLFAATTTVPTKVSAADVDNAAVSSLVFDPRNDIFSKTLTMVRTGDPQVLKALPPELRVSSSMASSRRAINSVISAVAAEGAAPELSTKLNDEEVFQAAAQYITNLESMWRRTISESNTMHIVVENYNKEMQKQEETIALLEAKVRELQAYLTQLERRGNVARVSAV